MNKHQRKTYIVAGIKSWNRKVFSEIVSKYPGRWIFYSAKEQLTYDSLISLNPRYLFFLHWSWIVPDEIVDKYECICFHMTDVPYGRGGNPLQNLIMQGKRQTKLSAFRMVRELDAGPVYMKRELSLEGNAEEIYIRATNISAEMIKDIIQAEPVAIPQAGDVVIFKRRNPAQSIIPRQESLSRLYDFIRMLDAKGYPYAYLEHAGFRYEFHRAKLYDGKIKANVVITPIKGDKNE
jgi:methionyl-tRNA formyltransferase